MIATPELQNGDHAPSPRGLTDPQQFLQIRALLSLNQGDTERVIAHLEYCVSDTSRTVDDRVMDLRLLRRAYEEFHSFDRAVEAAERERQLLSDIHLPYAQVLVRQGLAAFYQRRGENHTALELIDELEFLIDTTYEDLVQGSQSLFNWVESKATMTKLEALLGSAQWSSAKEVITTASAHIDQPLATVWVMNGLLSGYEEKAGLQPSNGESAVSWFNRILESDALPGVTKNPNEYSWAEWRYLARGIESSIGLTYGFWQYPNLPQDRFEIYRALAQRLIQRWTNNPEEASASRAKAREVEQRHGIVWPYYAEAFNFLYYARTQH
jgi:tetratricopeptide (TPR) repeat protein